MIFDYLSQLVLLTTWWLAQHVWCCVAKVIWGCLLLNPCSQGWCLLLKLHSQGWCLLLKRPSESWCLLLKHRSWMLSHDGDAFTWPRDHLNINRHSTPWQANNVISWNTDRLRVQTRCISAPIPANLLCVFFPFLTKFLHWCRCPLDYERAAGRITEYNDEAMFRRSAPAYNQYSSDIRVADLSKVLLVANPGLSQYLQMWPFSGSRHRWFCLFQQRSGMVAFRFDGRTGRCIELIP